MSAPSRALAAERADRGLLDIAEAGFGAIAPEAVRFARLGPLGARLWQPARPAFAVGA